MTDDLDIGIQLLPSGDIAQCGQLPKVAKSSLYKTELCKRFMETGSCRYGSKCQFAHGEQELRGILRHPKYKTVKCKNFMITGICPYGSRCRFLHGESSSSGMSPSLSMDDSSVGRKPRLDKVASAGDVLLPSNGSPNSPQNGLSDSFNGEHHTTGAPNGTAAFVATYGTPASRANALTASVDVTSVDWSMPGLSRSLSSQPEVEQMNSGAGGQHPLEMYVGDMLPSPSSNDPAHPGQGSKSKTAMMMDDRWRNMMYATTPNGVMAMRPWGSESSVPVSYVFPGVNVGVPISQVAGAVQVQAMSSATSPDGQSSNQNFEPYLYYSVPPVTPYAVQLGEAIEGLAAVRLGVGNGANDSSSIQAEGVPAMHCVACFAGQADCQLEPCYHAFHEQCVQPWLQSRNACPVCATPVEKIHGQYAGGTSPRENLPHQGQDLPTAPTPAASNEEITPDSNSGSIDTLNAHSDPVLSQGEGGVNKQQKVINPRPIGRGSFGAAGAFANSLSLYIGKEQAESPKHFSTLNL